jgi:hypothetical protein
MLYVLFHKSGQIDDEISWHVGEKFPRITDHVTPTLIQADGDELDYILLRTEHVRKAGGKDGKGYARVMKWFGEDAKFILHNVLAP